MKLKNSHLLLILIAILIAITVFIFIRNKKESGNFPYKELSFTAKDITAIEIYPGFDQKKSFKISKKGLKWHVITSQKTNQADSAFVETALLEIEKISPDHFVTSEPEKWKEYGVDSSGTLVIIYSNDKKTSLVVGNMTFLDDIYVSSYIRINGSNDVYATECYLEGTLKKDYNGWLKK